MTDTNCHRWSGIRLPRGRESTMVLFVAPLLVLLAIFLIYPLESAIDLSFRRAKAFSSVPAPFVGSQNYRSLIHDPVFASLIWHSLIRGVGGAIPSYLFGLLAAIVLNSWRRGMSFFRVLTLVPFVLSIPISVNIWLQLLDPHSGWLGTRIGKSNGLLGDPQTVWPTLLLINAWLSFSFYTILLLAALQRIPPDLYEAAQIDGAGAFRRFVHVTMPGVARASAVFLCIHFMLSFQDVNVVLVATAGGPANETQTLATYAYENGFRSFNLGFAAAASIVSLLSMLLFVTVGFVVLFCLLRLRRPVAAVVVFPATIRLRLSAYRGFWRGRGTVPSKRVLRGSRRSAHPAAVSALGYAAPVLLTLVTFAPLLIVLSRSFDGSPASAQPPPLVPRQPTFQNYASVLGNPALRGRSGSDIPPFYLNFFNSILVALIVTALVLLVAAPAGYGLSRARGLWAKPTMFLILLAQFVPPLLLVFPLYRELSRIGLIDSRLGLALVTSVLATPLSTLLFKTFFDSSPRELEEAASIDGANAFRIFFSVVLPLSRPVLGAVAAFSLIGSWNEFLFALTFINDGSRRTLPSALYLFTSTQDYFAATTPGQQAVYIVVPVLLAVCLLVATQRHFTAAYQGGGVKQ